jgi:hypothetical protein
MARVFSLIAFCLALVLPASAFKANEDYRRRNVLAGRWNAVFDMPQGSYETPVEFTVGQNGEVAASVLGPLGTFRIASTAGRLDGNNLTLEANTSRGKVKVTATLEGDQLKGEWSLEGLLSLFFNFKGAFSAQRDRAHVSKPHLQVFDSVLAHIERDFYTPDLNGVNVSTLGRRYRERARASRTDGEFLYIMRQMLSEFRASHLDFFASSSGSRELQAAGRIPAAGGTTGGISWRQLTPTVGYLRIESFENGPRAVARVDRAFAALGHNAAIIIDLRGNVGGTLSAAMRLGDYILPQMQPVGYFASRDGLSRHRVRSIDQLNPSALPVFSGYNSEDFAREMASKGALILITGARAERVYRGRVVVLIDEYCFSASEALASVVKETRAATLIGRRTTGAMLSATTFSVGGGWTLLLPVWDFRTPRGVRVEGKGVEPDIEVKHFVGQDADITAALKFLDTSPKTEQKAQTH